MMRPAPLLTVMAALTISPASLEGADGPLNVTSNVVDGRWLADDGRIEIVLSRPLDRARERLAVLIGDTDWTGLFAAGELSFTYGAGPVRLPAGESRMAVYVVSEPNDWRQIAGWTLRVRPPVAGRSAFVPKFDISNKGQIAEGHRPESNAPPRETFQDVSVSLGLRGQYGRGGRTVSSQLNLLGVSHRPEALRFGVEGAAAPKLDMADYLLEAESARGKLSLGHLAFTTHRHLVTKLASRGVSLTARLPRTEITAAALNANNIVGFDNPLGLANRSNQVAFVVVGTDLVKSRLGESRLEASFVDGARLPRSGFTQGQITDAEEGRGHGVRLTARDAARRVRLDAGFAQSRFRNPADALLSQGFTLVPSRPRTSDAAYVDLAYDVLRGARIRGVPLAVTTGYRFERVDPLYRSVAAPQAVRSDLLEHAVEISGSIGQVTAQASHTASHDNLAKIPTILRTDTAVTTFGLGVPLASFSRSRRPSPWLPATSYLVNRSAQAGAGVPERGGFASVSQVPDQSNVTQSFRSDWTLRKWRVGYAANHAFQDNRQEGRESADFISVVQLVTVGAPPTKSFDLSTDLGFEKATAKEAGRVTRTRRIGVNAAWRLTRDATVTAIAGLTRVRETTADRSNTADANLQYSHSVGFPARGVLRPRAQLFGRWSWQSSDQLLATLQTSSRRRAWTLSSGLTFTVF